MEIFYPIHNCIVKNKELMYTRGNITIPYFNLRLTVKRFNQNNTF